MDMDCHGSTTRNHHLSSDSTVRNQLPHIEPHSDLHFPDAPFIVQAPHSIEIHHHAYDPNLSSAARYSPPNYNTISTIDLDTQLQEIVQSSVASSSAAAGEEYHVDHATNAITYSNVIFVPNTGNNADSENANSLLDAHQHHTYILSSDPRLFGSYIRGSHDDEEATLANEVAHNNASGAGGVALEYHGYHIQSETGEYIETITGCEQQEVVDTETGDTQIIIQGTNGQFYRQIQQQHVYGGGGDDRKVVGDDAMALVLNDGHAASMAGGYDQAIFHAAYEDLQHMEMVHANGGGGGGGATCGGGGVGHPLDGLSMMPSVADAELLINSSEYAAYRSEYAGLDSDGLLAAHHLIDLGGDYGGSVGGGGSMARTPLAEELAFLERQHERSLLESTMSPLLAAVNDITSRDEHLQQYLEQNALKDNHMHTQQAPLTHSDQFHQHFQPTDYHNLGNIDKECSMQPPAHRAEPPPPVYQAPPMRNAQPLPSPSSYNRDQPPAPHQPRSHVDQSANADEYVDINDMEFQTTRETTSGRENLLVRRSQRTTKKQEELLIADRHVPCRAWASVPSGYLAIGQSREVANEYSVFAKKDIPLRTKFGPIEGDIKCLLPSELELIKSDAKRALPVLFVDNIRMVDVSNEYTSNWMRFVRLANTFTEQNMLLDESADCRLYFRCCQPIAPKDEVKVGYGREYATRYGLPFLEATTGELQAINERWACFECDHKFETSQLLQAHLAEHGKRQHVSTKEQKATLNGRRRRKRISRLSTRKVSGPTVRYACCYCSQVFSQLMAFKKHNEAEHTQQVAATRLGIDAAATTASILQNSNVENRERNNRCEQCRRYFPSVERLEKHRRLHCPTNANKLIHCKLCPKKLLTDSAMAMHVKSHLNNVQFFQCVLCAQRFTLSVDITEHVQQHLENGCYNCPKCGRKYTKYADLRKHVRSIHPDVSFPCPDCGRCFKSPNKLRLHRLWHSDVRAFKCAECSWQFKRKDKLQMHMISQHSRRKGAVDEPSQPQMCAPKKVARKPDKVNVGKRKKVLPNMEIIEASNNVDPEPLPSKPNVTSPASSSTTTVINVCPPLPPIAVSHIPPQPKPFPVYLPDQSMHDYIEPPPADPQDTAKTTPSLTIDYQRFIYKCHTCRLGFKRRGMLVNHLVKLHPSIPVDSVPELNLPIIKAQRFYYCAYCDKVYKSNSKRKWHIMKNHPGRELPASCKVLGATVQTEPGVPNASFSEPIGNQTALPQQCNWCHKQYASKGRLLNHQRQAHAKQVAELSTQSKHKATASDPNAFVYHQSAYSEQTFGQFHDTQQIAAHTKDQFADYLPNDQNTLYQM